MGVQEGKIKDNVFSQTDLRPSTLNKSDYKFLDDLDRILTEEISSVGVGKKTGIDRERILHFLKKSTPIVV